VAKGRMINSQICRDKKINDLSDDTCRLIFTWLITFADCEGRAPGDPAIVRSMVFPRRDGFTNEQMRVYLSELAAVGLIVQYEANGDQWIWFPNFDKNQQGLRKDREAESIIPPPCIRETIDLGASELRTYSGPTPDLLPVKLIEEKRIEEKRKSATPPASQDMPSKRKKTTATDLPPAVQVFQGNAGVYPVKTWNDDIDATVGRDIPALEFWGKVVKAYVGLGWNARNVSNMLDFFQRHEIPGQNGKSQAPATIPDESTANIHPVDIPETGSIWGGHHAQ
jgi:hypothetical protein